MNDVPVVDADGTLVSRGEAYAWLRDPNVYWTSMRYAHMFQGERLKRFLKEFEEHERATDPEGWRRLQKALAGRSPS